MKNKGLITAIITLSVFVGFLSFRVVGNSRSLGSIAPGGEYMYKNITTADASSTAAVAIPVRGGAGTLGSVIINTTNSSSTVVIYDSPSEATNPIAKFPLSAGTGTYTFDVAVTHGITIIPTTGFNGNWTITYR